MKLSNSLYFLIFFSALLFIVGSSVYLYGFTSSPTTSAKHSIKANPYVKEMTFKDKAQQSIYEQQWFPTQSTQVIFMIVDSLPYFYVVNEEEQQEKAKLSKQGVDDPQLFVPSRNVPFLEFLDSLSESQSNTILMKGYAHPPTYTTTRTKAILQGNLPTYDQLTANLGSKELMADNIFKQAKQNNPFKGQKREKVVCYGSHFIHNLFPTTFDRGNFVGEVQFYLRHKNDINQYKYIEKEQLEYDDWSAMLIHFDGVDAASHLAKKLDDKFIETIKSVNQLVKNVIDNMSKSEVNTDQTIIAVSDHGINYDVYSHHGGYTHQETNTFIYGRSKHQFLLKSKKDIGQVMDRKFLIGSETFQINMTPTYCMLLGIPIPYNNIGMIQQDFFLDVPAVDDFVIANNFYTNFRQVQDNFENILSGFNGQIKQLGSIIKLASEIKDSYKNLFENSNENTTVNLEKLKSFIENCHSYSKLIAKTIQTDFQQVQIEDMWSGFFIHVCISVFMLALITSLNLLSDKKEEKIKQLMPSLLFKIKVSILIMAILSIILFFSLQLSSFVFSFSIISLVLLFLVTVSTLVIIKRTKCFSLERIKEYLSVENIFDLIIFVSSVVLYLMTRTSNDIYNEIVEIYSQYILAVCLLLIALLSIKFYQKEIDNKEQSIKLLIQIISIPVLLYLCRYYNTNANSEDNTPPYFYSEIIDIPLFRNYIPLLVFLIFYGFVFFQIWKQIYSESQKITKAFFIYFHFAQVLSVVLFYFCQWKLTKISRYQTVLPVIALYHTIIVEILKIIFFYKQWLPQTSIFLKMIYFVSSFTVGVSCILEQSSLIQVPLYFIVIYNLISILSNMRVVSWMSSSSILFSLSLLFYYLSGHMEYLEEIHADVFQLGVIDESSLTIPIFNGCINTLYYFIITPAFIPFLVKFSKKCEGDLSEFEPLKIFFETEDGFEELEDEQDLIQQNVQNNCAIQSQTFLDSLYTETNKQQNSIFWASFKSKTNYYYAAFLSPAFIGIIGSDLRDLMSPYDPFKEEKYIPNYLFAVTFAMLSFIVISINSFVYRNQKNERKQQSVVLES